MKINEGIRQQQKSALESIQQGLKNLFLSPATAKKMIRDMGIKNVRIAVGGHKDNSKYTLQDLRDMRARNGVGRPPHILKARREKMMREMDAE